MELEYEKKMTNQFSVEFDEKFKIYPNAVKRCTLPTYANGEWQPMHIIFEELMGSSVSDSLLKLVEETEYISTKLPHIFQYYIHMKDMAGVVVQTWVISVEKILEINFGHLDYGNGQVIEPLMILKPNICYFKDLS